MRGMNPNSLRNLKPCRPGEVRNPAGRKASGAVVADWLNAFALRTLGALAKILADPKATTAQVAAARIWLLASAGDGESLDRIFDRTVGKAKASVDMTSGGEAMTIGVPMEGFFVSRSTGNAAPA